MQQNFVALVTRAELRGDERATIWRATDDVRYAAVDSPNVQPTQRSRASTAFRVRGGNRPWRACARR
jgi:hypothetical protein